MPTPNADESMGPIWRQRPRPVGAEVSYVIDGGTLSVATTRQTERFDLASVDEVRFVYAPSNVSTKGFRTRLRMSNGRRIAFGNLSWRSLTDMDHDDGGYHAFVAALSETILRANPNVRFRGGQPRLLWGAGAVLGVLSLLMLAGFTVRALMQGTGPVALLGGFLLAASAWQVWPMIRLNRPRDLSPGEVPDGLVPGRPSR